MMNRKLISLLILMLGCLTIVNAQNDGKIVLKGTIVDGSTNELETATAKASGKDAEIAKMKTECEEMTKKLNWIRKTKAEADAEIKKLTNQVNLLKKELNK